MRSDQATRLREMAAQMRSQVAEKRPTRVTQVIAVTSGKGGVGKSNMSVNIAQALRAMNKEVIVWDADLGFANADILLGTTPKWHLGHIITGEKDILEVIHESPTGIKLIAGGSGLGDLAEQAEEKVAEFLRALQKLNGLADYIILDTGAGFNKVVEGFTLSADQIIVVITPEPTAVADAYGLIKSLAKRRGNHKLNMQLIVNMAGKREKALAAAERITVTAKSFLDLDIELLGIVPDDPLVSQSVEDRKPFFLAYPYSAASQALNGIVGRLVGVSVPTLPQQLVAKNGGGFFDKVKSFFGR